MMIAKIVRKKNIMAHNIWKTTKERSYLNISKNNKKSNKRNEKLAKKEINKICIKPKKEKKKNDERRNPAIQ